MTFAVLTASELSERWGISLGTLSNWRGSGKGPPFFRPGGGRGKALYRLEAIEDYERKNEIKQKCPSGFTMTTGAQD